MTVNNSDIIVEVIGRILLNSMFDMFLKRAI